MPTTTLSLEQRAAAVAQAGFGPLPLPAGLKHQPPPGAIGADDPLPSYADWYAWMETTQYRNYTNLGARVPPGVIAIDVDSYKDSGLQRWQELDGPNWAPTYRVSARGFEDGMGHWFYRPPTGHDAGELPSKWGGIETLRFWHRYTMAPGSWNNDAEAEYECLDMRTGEMQPTLPDVTDIPEMPLEMWERLIVTQTNIRPGTSDVPLNQNQTACALVADIRMPNWGDGSRYDTMRDLVWRLIRLHHEGHSGVKEAVIELKAAYLSEMDAHPRRGGGPPEIEFDRALTQAEAKQQGYTDECRCDLSPFVLEETLWDRSPELQHVHDVAVGYKAAPLGTLLTLLASLVATTAPNIVLPPLVGGNASTNLFVMLVGDSGGGKGACERAAEQVLTYSDWAMVETPGSGEGLAHTFGHRERGELVRHATNIVLSVAEVDTWQALSQRNGSTLDSEIRKAAMGERLGFGYADPNKRIPIEAHSYRLCMLVGIQPERGEWMLSSAAGGTPQRFAWAPTWNPTAERNPPPPPPPQQWQPPTDYPFADEFGWVVLPVCEAAVETVAEQRYLGLTRQASDPLDGHRTLVRLRVANALGLLHGRAGVNDEDWETSGILMRISNSVRHEVERALAKVAENKNAGFALREVDKLEIISGKQEAQCLNAILRTLENHQQSARHKGEGCYKKCLRLGIRSTVRVHFNPMLERALNAEQVVLDEHGRYWRGKTP